MQSILRPRRSALYVPGSNARALEKAPALSADVLIFDLEDSVAPERKDAAREAVVHAVGALADDPRERVIRVNDLDSPWIARDIAAVSAAAPDAILIPKVMRADDIRRARGALAAAGAPKSLQIWLMIETPTAVLNIASIAGIASIPEPSIGCFVFGSNDLAASLRVHPGPDRTVLLPYIAQTLLAARAYGITMLDGTFNNLEDNKGFRAECLQGHLLGMDGKTCIHPSQIPTANEAFAPTTEEIDWARKVVSAFSAPDAAGMEVLRLSGQMVERLHERQARRTLQFADSIRRREDALKPIVLSHQKTETPADQPKA